MTTEEVLWVTRQAVERAGWDLADYGEPQVRHAGGRWEVVYPPNASMPSRPHLNVWLDDNSGDVSVDPMRWPTLVAVTKEEFIRQADGVAAEAGWLLADYVKGEVFDHGDSWSVLYKGRSGLPSDYFSVELVHTLGAMRVRPGY